MPQLTESAGRVLVGGQVDNQLLVVWGGKFEDFPVPPQLVSGGRVAHPQLTAGRREMLAEAAGELRAGDGCELGLEPFGAGDGRAEPQAERLLVRDVIPVGEGVRGARIGEDCVYVRSLVGGISLRLHLDRAAVIKRFPFKYFPSRWRGRRRRRLRRRR